MPLEPRENRRVNTLITVYKDVSTWKNVPGWGKLGTEKGSVNGWL